MIGWIIVIIILLLLLTLPLGVDAAYKSPESFLKLKIGLFRLQLLPRAKPKKQPKQKEETPKEEQPDKKPKSKPKLSLTDLRTLLDIALQALRRIGMHLSIDRLRLLWTAGASDPYAAVMQYGRVNEALGILGAAAHRVFRFRDEDVRTEIDFTAERPEIEARLVMSLQVWEILLIAVCAAASFLKWYFAKKKENKAAAESAARKEPA